MAQFFSRRNTHRDDGAAVVSLSVIRVNRLLAVAAKRGVRRGLGADSTLGMLGYVGYFSARGALVVEYRREVDALIKDAQSPSHVHRPASSEFDRWSRQSRGAIGIWHETFALATGDHECVCVDIPENSAAASDGSAPARGQRGTPGRRFAGA